MEYDFIIVGSGYGGLIPAWRLTRAGARVLLIERGRRMDPREFQQSWDPLYLQYAYDFGFSTDLTSTYRASRVLGGGTVMNSMMHQRTPSAGFDFEDVTSRRRAWPRSITRAVMDPYYEQVEDLLSVRHLEWNQVPRIGANFGRMFHDAGLSCDRARMNIGPGCVHCGFCEAGCRFDNAKITLVGRALSEAMATGNLYVEENLTASKILKKRGAYQVNCVRTGQPFNGAPEKSFVAPRVIVAAGPLGSVPLLFRSNDELKLSKSLGEHAGNNGDVNFIFMIPEHYPDNIGYRSTNNAGMISYAFWNDHRVTMHPGFSPIAVMAGIDAHLEGKLAWGLEHKHLVKEKAINRLIPVNAMRQIDPDSRLGIDDKGGVKITIVSEKRRIRHAKYMLALAKQVAYGCGGNVMISGFGNNILDQGGNHIIGGARMNDDPKYGLTSPEGEVYGHKGLYVSDAASIPCSLGINPALTIGANALRIADKIVCGSNA